ncbi:MAG: phospholipase D-like domain-containing protein [Lachnospiraceae bacterium]
MMENTQETKAAVKNGVVRMVFAVISILLEVVVILSLLYLAGQKAGWVYSAIRFLGAMVVLRIYGSHKTASIRMTWMLVILLIPIFGTALYVMIGLNGHSLKMRKRYEDIDKILFPMLPDGEKEAENARKRDGRLGGIVDYIRRNAGYPVYQNTKVEYFDDAEKGIEAQKKDMAKAEKFIFMEYHAIEDAESWHEIRDVLAERVKAGVEVRVFYDDMGSLGFINTDFVKRTEEYGIQCRVFNPFAPGLNLFLNNRDHRKITVIDGKVGYTGGYNLANEYFHKTEPFGFWKDTGVRLEGDAVQSLTVTFLEMWNAISGEDRDDKDFKKYMFNSSAAYVMQEKDRKIQDDPKLSKERRESIAKGRETIEKNRDAYFEKMRAEISQDEKYLADTTPIEGSSLGFVQPYADTPMDDIHVGEDVYISMAESAQKYAWFITPYLIITDEMCHAFSLAARRGVDVRIITPGIPDKKLVYSLTRSYYNGLTRNGVRVFEFTPGFCHAKMSIADDLMATCGTINLDYRSLYHHFENGCLYADCDAVMDTKRDFEETFKQCREVTEYYTSGRGAFLRFSQLLLRLAAPLM